jgi:hypothetical protein
VTAGINISDKVNFIWSIADLLRGPYKPHQYGRVIIPLTVLRRLDCVLEPTKESVLAEAKRLKSGKIKNIDPILERAADQRFYNTSAFDFAKLKADPNGVAANLVDYILGFSPKARDILENFKLEAEIVNLDARATRSTSTATSTSTRRRVRFRRSRTISRRWRSGFLGCSDAGSANSNRDLHGNMTDVTVQNEVTDEYEPGHTGNPAA